MDRRRLYLYLIVGVAFIVLFILSRKEKVEERSALLVPFERAAAWFYAGYLALARKRRGKLFRAVFPGEKSLEGKMSLLDPSSGVKEAEKYCIESIRNLLMFIFLADMLALLLYGKASGEMNLEDGVLSRNTYGGSTKEVQLTAEPFGGSYTVSVESRKYTKEQADSLEEELAEKLPSLILGENPDPEHVRTKLNLVSRVRGYPFRIAWLLSDYTYMDRDGTVHAEEVPEGEEVPVRLTAQLSYDGNKWEEVLDVTILPEVLTPEESFEKKVGEAVVRSGEESAYDEVYVLPSEKDGVQLTWSETAEDDSLPVFVFFVLAGIVVCFAGSGEVSRKVKKRNGEIELDYPHLVSMIVLFLGAGMSVRNVFYKIGNDYREERTKGGKKRYVYEEILLLCNRLDSGISEAEAIGYFGMRCGSRSYTRLCALLVQNLKKGNAQLLQSLRQETDEAMQTRKNTAVRLGEEAGTKLLFPMVMMLIVAMIMIVIPAYLGFSM